MPHYLPLFGRGFFPHSTCYQYSGYKSYYNFAFSTNERRWIKLVRSMYYFGQLNINIKWSQNSYLKTKPKQQFVIFRPKLTFFSPSTGRLNTRTSYWATAQAFLILRKGLPKSLNCTRWTKNLDLPVSASQSTEIIACTMTQGLSSYLNEYSLEVLNGVPWTTKLDTERIRTANFQIVQM